MELYESRGRMKVYNTMLHRILYYYQPHGYRLFFPSLSPNQEQRHRTDPCKPWNKLDQTVSSSKRDHCFFDTGCGDAQPSLCSGRTVIGRRPAAAPRPVPRNKEIANRSYTKWKRRSKRKSNSWKGITTNKLAVPDWC